MVLELNIIIVYIRSLISLFMHGEKKSLRLKITFLADKRTVSSQEPTHQHVSRKAVTITSS